MEGTCIKSTVKSVSLHLEAWSIIENKLRFIPQLKRMIWSLNYAIATEAISHWKYSFLLRSLQCTHLTVTGSCCFALN